MLFGTHLVAAAALAERWRRSLSPRRALSPRWWVALAVAGAAFPDVVDKPLASAGVVDLFHSVGHSALLAVAFAPLAYYSLAGRAFAVGWASHLALDAVHVVVNGRADDALFLGWPLTEPATPLGIPPGEFFWYYLWSPSFFLEIGIWLAAAVVLRPRVSDAVDWARRVRG